LNAIYPSGPDTVPANLTAPSSAYKRHAWLAMGGLLLFVLSYFGLLFWFLWTAYRVFKGVGSGNSDDGFLAILVGCAAIFLAIFMAKALVFVKRADASEDYEIKPADQPELFRFLHRLADEAGAPRPHRVYISPRVNAAVFYDLSVFNLVFPSKKNLEIGLGLVNVLSLGELKAVLAHEFGHFAQRTMAVGRWVYIAHQIASHIITKRDALDEFLIGISNVDIRFAWIGWILRLVVWAIRSLVELIFRVVVIAQRALSREMEYQADLVAVSLTGSDALVNALHRLGAADDAWDRALSFAVNELNQERGVLDVFALQTRIIEQLGKVYNDQNYGQAAKVPDVKPQDHRVFRVELAQPPKMWATHPANADRENNAKRNYIVADIDQRSALLLFDNVDQLKQEITRKIFTGTLPPAVPMADTLERLDKDFSRSFLDRRYRGVYLGRSVVRHAKQIDDLYETTPGKHDVIDGLNLLYPEGLSVQLDQLRDLQSEHATLLALQAGHLTTAGGVVRWRGEEIARRDLPKVIATLDTEIKPIYEAVLRHDRECRSAHMLAARSLGQGWPEYLRSQLQLLHYADHAEADLRDSQRLLGETVAVVMADRRVSADELRRLLAACNQLGGLLFEAHALADKVQLDERIQQILGVKNLRELLGDRFTLPAANDKNINEWMRAIDSWVNAAANAFSRLRSASLENLLRTEAEIDAACRNKTAIDSAPAVSTMAGTYPVLAPGMERQLLTKLSWWDRFQMAEGVFPTIARFAAAGSILGAVLLMGSSVGETKLSMYNGLARVVNVEIDGSPYQLSPNSSATITMPISLTHEIIAKTQNGELIESFSAESETGASHYIYNVAAAAPLVQWTIVYGDGAGPPETHLGASRWSSISADYVFEEPPESIRSKTKNESRSVVSSLTVAPVAYMVDAVKDQKARQELISVHARWDEQDSAGIEEWLYFAGKQPGFEEILRERLKRNPKEMVALRAEQNAAEGDARKRVCDRHEATAASASQDPDWRYLAIRCMPDGTTEQTKTKNDAFIAAQKLWPNHSWLSYAAGYSYSSKRDWEPATTSFQYAAAHLPNLTDRLMLELARIAREKNTGTSMNLEQYSRQSKALQFELNIENGIGLEGNPNSAYNLMAKGELDQALQVSEPVPEMNFRMKRFVGASDTASKEQVGNSINLPVTQGIDQNTVWIAIALASREGKPVDELVQWARDNDVGSTEALLRFMEAVRTGQTQQAAEAALGEVDTFGRGSAYSMATIMMGQNCPAGWRQSAKNLLFATERPYFR